MAGLSSKALAFGEPENRKKYNGIEFENVLGIDEYEAQLRNLDPQVGRWWEIDPKTENQEIWSPYVSNNDNPIQFADPLGDEAEDCCKGVWNAIVQTAKDLTNFSVSAVNAFVTNQVGGAGRGDAESFSDPHDVIVSQSGQVFGDLLTIGVAAMIDVGGGSAIVATGGALTVPAGAIMTQQTLVAAPTAIKNLASNFNSLLYSNSNSSSNKKESSNSRKNSDYGSAGGSEHKTNSRPSNKSKHEAGQARKIRDRQGSKGMSNPPRRRPAGWKGPWPV